MTIARLAFAYFAAASTASALLAVTRRNPVHGVLWVLSLFLHVAGIFLFLRADFLAAVQVIVYAGAILVLYLFVVMLLNLRGEECGRVFEGHGPAALAAGAGFVVLVGLILERTDLGAAVGGAAASQGPGPMKAMGLALYRGYALPFEIASLVLLVAIIGAMVLAKKQRNGSGNRQRLQRNEGP